MRTGRTECRLYEDMNVRRPTRQEAGRGCEAGERVGSRGSLEMDRGGEPAGIVTLQILTLKTLGSNEGCREGASGIHLLFWPLCRRQVGGGRSGCWGYLVILV